MSINKTEIKKAFIVILDNQLNSNGFIKVKNSEWVEYIKKTGFGFNRVTPIINQYSNIFFVSIGFAIRLDVISDIISSIKNISDEFKDSYTTIGGGFQYLRPFEDSRIQVGTPEELSSALQILESILEKEAMEFFKKYETVESIDMEVNREDLPKNSVFYGVSVQPFIGLTSAFLNKNPKYDFWVAYYRDKLENANQHLKNQFEKLVVFLNEYYSQTT